MNCMIMSKLFLAIFIMKSSLDDSSLEMMLENEIIYLALFFWFQVDMAALRQMRDNDLKEMGIPMVFYIFCSIFFAGLTFYTKVSLDILNKLND